MCKINVDMRESLVVYDDNIMEKRVEKQDNKGNFQTIELIYHTRAICQLRCSTLFSLLSFLRCSTLFFPFITILPFFFITFLYYFAFILYVRERFSTTVELFLVYVKISTILVF